MHNPMIESVMKFTGGLLSFAAIVWILTSNKLQKARSKSDPRRILGILAGIACGLLFITGFICFYLAPQSNLGFLLIGVGYGAMMLSYIAVPGPATREDTAQVIIASILVSVLTFIFLLEAVATK
jgi:energy-converting hydrogenase Eha subunit G